MPQSYIIRPRNYFGQPRPLRCRLALAALLGAALAITAGGCAFDGQIVARATGGGPFGVVQSVEPEQTPHRVQGVTRKKGQRVGIACDATILYDVREATGTAVLAQRYRLSLRTKRLPRGVAYSFDCTGPLVLELPAEASTITATATIAGGPATALAVRAPITSVALAFGKRLRPEPEAQLALVEWPRLLPRGHYHVETSFSVPDARPFRERALTTASIRCGRASYLQPVLPTLTQMSRAPQFKIDPASASTTLVLPRIAIGIKTFSQATRTLSCRP
jgi:hypothetical protein